MGQRGQLQVQEGAQSLIVPSLPWLISFLAALDSRSPFRAAGFFIDFICPTTSYMKCCLIDSLLLLYFPSIVRRPKHLVGFCEPISTCSVLKIGQYFSLLPRLATAGRGGLSIICYELCSRQ